MQKIILSCVSIPVYWSNVSFQFIHLILVDSSESSGESVSGLSSSGYSFQSVIGGEHDVHSLVISDTGLGKPEDHQQDKEKSNPQNQNREQPLKVSFVTKCMFIVDKSLQYMYVLCMEMIVISFLHNAGSREYTHGKIN